MSLVAIQLFLASGLVANVYGFGEKYCGDPEQPSVCDTSAVTASGAKFSPWEPTAALAVPDNYRMRKQFIYLRIEEGDCQKILLTDKKNSRYISSRPFDLTPAAVKLLTGSWPSKSWSGKVFLCGGTNGRY